MDGAVEEEVAKQTMQSDRWIDDRLHVAQHIGKFYEQNAEIASTR